VNARLQTVCLKRKSGLRRKDNVLCTPNNANSTRGLGKAPQLIFFPGRTALSCRGGFTKRIRYIFSYKETKLKFKKTTCILLITINLLLGRPFFAMAADYILVVHKENPVDRISSQEVKDIFLGKKTKWGNDAPITLVMNTNEEIHEQFTRIMLQKSPVQLSVYWKKILYSGVGMLPLAVKDDESAKAYVGTHKNAISYITDDSLDRQVKKVEIR